MLSAQAIKNKILIIDDEANICMGCQRIFKGKGYTVKIAFSGKEGLDRACKEEFDVIITDLKMPDISGIEVIKKIKEKKPDQPIILITGYATVCTAVEAMKLGVEYYIKKPFRPDEIIDAVKNILDKRKKHYTASNKKSVQQEIIDREQVLEVLKPHFALSKRN